MEGIPWDLRGYAKERLERRQLEELCRLCTARSITPGGTKESCVERLLQWKQELKDAFQENPAIQVAVVGLTAAGVGLSFTAAATSIFAELHWTPVRPLRLCLFAAGAGVLLRLRPLRFFISHAPFVY